ncbi:MAG: hypothetical protein J0I21_06460 [Alphaproteobacteria bacterium]|nr:hypothetical protein [Alphaproteobacteria bacterium]
MDAIDSRFTGIDDIALEDRSGEVVATVRPYQFVFHTWMRTAQTDLSHAEATLRTRNRYLREHLIAELEAGERILVRKSNAPAAETDIDRLLAALHRYGPNTLLWVRLADAAHPSGSVEASGPGLLCGYVDRFAPYVRAGNASFEAWAAVCRQAWQRNGAATRMYAVPRTRAAEPWVVDFTRGLDAPWPTGLTSMRRAFQFTRAGPALYRDRAGHMVTVEPDTPRLSSGLDGTPRGLVLEPEATNLLPLADSFVASFAPVDGMAAAPSDDVPPLRHRAAVMRHMITRPNAATRVYHQLLSAGLEVGATYCCSCWVWIPAAYSGSRVSAMLHGSTTRTDVPADLARRDCWQRSWSVGVVASDPPVLAPSMHLTGTQGDVVYSTCWQLEAGGGATSYIPTADAPASRAAEAARCSGSAFGWFDASAPGTLEWEGWIAGRVPGVLRLSDGCDPQTGIVLAPSGAATAAGEAVRIVATFNDGTLRCRDSLGGAAAPVALADPLALCCLELLPAPGLLHQRLRYSPGTQAA